MFTLELVEGKDIACLVDEAYSGCVGGRKDA
jgi:hypothetical protein